MKQIRKAVAFLAALLLLLPGWLRPIAAEDDVTLLLSDTVADGGQPELGDTVTFLATVTKNEGGFAAGTFYFAVSDNLSYESATLFGEPIDALPALEGDNAGSYGVAFLDNRNFLGVDTVLCTVTYRVVGVGQITAALVPYEVIRDVTPTGSQEPVTEPVSISVSGSLSHTVAEPAAPVVTTESLPRGVVGKAYSRALTADVEDGLSWEIADGALPDGLTLLNDGTVTGVPTAFGDFTFSVIASYYNAVTSDEVSFTITILEKPEVVELADGSQYRIEEENGVRYLLGIRDRTSLAVLMDNLLDPDSLTVCSASGDAIAEGSFVGTDVRIRLYEGEEILDEVVVVVLGDTDGNGRIGTLDYQRIRSNFRGNYELTGAFLKAARVSGREKVGTLDYQRVRAYFRGLFNLYA